MPRELVKHDFLVCLGACFWRRLAFESVDSAKRVALSLLPAYEGIIPSIEGPGGTKRRGRVNSVSSRAGRPSFPALGLGASGSQTFGLRLEFTPSVPLVLRPSDLD